MQKSANSVVASLFAGVNSPRLVRSDIVPSCSRRDACGRACKPFEKCGAQVAHLVADGLRNKKIGARLNRKRAEFARVALEFGAVTSRDLLSGHP